MIMEVEEKTSLISNDLCENNSKKGKILTLLFSAESKPVEGKEAKKDKNKPPTKVIIRRLPPKFTKAAFIEEFSPLPAHDYFHFVRGDLNLGSHAFSRAYINFINQEDIFSFKEKFDDYDLQDDKGRTYHAVVEFAPFQKIPKRNIVKKKQSKAGMLESDPKYTEFLQKMEESKNFINNPSEYFHETESPSLKTKIVTTPLLEFLKRKRKKKIDLRNEIRQRKKEAEKEKKKKDEEKKKAEKEKKKEEKKNFEKNKIVEEKFKKTEDRPKDKKKEEQSQGKKEEISMAVQELLESDIKSESHLNPVIPQDPAILEVVVRCVNKEFKAATKMPSKSEEIKPLKSSENDIGIGRSERKYSDFRTRLAEEKQRKSFYKRDVEDSKANRMNSGSRKGVPDEKGDNYNIGNCSEAKLRMQKLEAEADSKRHLIKETKSKFRYSEQRNREREFRQKTSDFKNPKNIQNNNIDSKCKIRETEIMKVSAENSLKLSENGIKKNLTEQKIRREINAAMFENINIDEFSIPSRRKSLEFKKNILSAKQKRSWSFHDISSKEFCGLECDKKIDTHNSDRVRDMNTPENESVQTDDNSKESIESDKMDDECRKDPRLERRIRNKDRPSIEIYRPGMGKFSKQRLEQKKEDLGCESATGTYFSSKSNRIIQKTISKKMLLDTKNSFKTEEFLPKSIGSYEKNQNEVKTMTFSRSGTKEN